MSEADIERALKRITDLLESIKRDIPADLGEIKMEIRDLDRKINNLPNRLGLS